MKNTFVSFLLGLYEVWQLKKRDWNENCDLYQLRGQLAGSNGVTHNLSTFSNNSAVFVLAFLTKSSFHKIPSWINSLYILWCRLPSDNPLTALSSDVCRLVDIYFLWRNPIKVLWHIETRPSYAQLFHVLLLVRNIM